MRIALTTAHAATTPAAVARIVRAFLVSEEEFDRMFERLTQRCLGYWADPRHQQPSAINHNDGSRGVYWSDPDGHSLEIITRPYGG